MVLQNRCPCIVSQHGFCPLFFLSLSKIFLPDWPSGSGNQAYYHAKTKRLTTEHPVIFKCSNDPERARVTTRPNDISSKSLPMSPCAAHQLNVDAALPQQVLAWINRLRTGTNSLWTRRHFEVLPPLSAWGLNSDASIQTGLLTANWCWLPMVEKSCMSCWLISGRIDRRIRW